MEWIIWVGAALTLLGLLGLVTCIFMGVKARREAGTEEDMRVRLQKVVALNMGALMLSILGLGTVVIGVLLA